MRTYLFIIRVLLLGSIPLFNATAQCTVPTTCQNTGSATSCTLLASSTYSSIQSFTATNVKNLTNNNIVITSGKVTVNNTGGISKLGPGVKITAVPCTFVPTVMYYKLTSVSCGATTASSEGQGGTQLAIPKSCAFNLQAYYRDPSNVEIMAHGLAPGVGGYWRYKDGSNTPVNYSSASSTVSICSTSWNIGGGVSYSSFTNSGNTTWTCLDLNDDQMFYQVGSVQWPVLSFSVQPSGGMANFAASGITSHFRIGEDEVTYDPSVSVYPNPNEGSFTLILPSSEAYEVSISDLLGNVILAENVSNAITKDYKLNYLSNGMYIVNVTGNGIQKRTKVQVMR